MLIQGLDSDKVYCTHKNW